MDYHTSKFWSQNAVFKLYCTEVKFIITLLFLLIINLANYPHLCSLISLKGKPFSLYSLVSQKRKDSESCCLRVVHSSMSWNILVPGVKTLWPQKLSETLLKPKPFNAKQCFSVSTCHKMMVWTQQYKQQQSFAFWVRDKELDAFLPAGRTFWNYPAA